MLADLHAGKPSIDSGSPALPFLTQALALCAGMDGYVVPADLYSQLAAAYAAAGDYRDAYRRQRSRRRPRRVTLGEQ